MSKSQKAEFKESEILENQFEVQAGIFQLQVYPTGEGWTWAVESDDHIIEYGIDELTFNEACQAVIDTYNNMIAEMPQLVLE